MPRTFLGFLFRRVPRTTPPASPAAAVTTPVTTAAFDGPFELELLELPPEGCADELRLRDDAALPLREAADDARRVDAPALFGLVREAADLLFDELRLLLPEPLELRLPCFLLLDERVLAWAIAPP